MSNGSTTEEKVVSGLLLETRAISGPIRSLKVHVVDLKTALATYRKKRAFDAEVFLNIPQMIVV